MNGLRPALALVLLAALTSCARDEAARPTGSPAPATTSTSGSSPSSPPSPPAAESPVPDSGTLRFTEVAELDRPVAFAVR